MADDLEARLQSHSKAFEGLLSLIPANLYYEKDTSDQWEKKKQTPEQRRLAKKAKLNPANHKTAKEVMDENERKRRREEDGEDNEAEETSDLEALGKEKPLEGLKKPKAKIQKKKMDDDVHSKDEETGEEKAQSSAQTQLPKKSPEEKKREKEQKRKEKRAKREEQEKAKQARKAAITKPAETTTELSPLDSAPIFDTTEEAGQEDVADLDNDMEAVDFTGLVADEKPGSSSASDSSAADSTFSHASNQVPSSNSSIVLPITNGTSKADTNGTTAQSAESTTQIDKSGKLSASEKEALMARLREKIEAHRKARNADGLNGQPAKNRQELIEARRIKAEKRKAHKKELREQEREKSKKAEMEAHLAELRGSPSIGSDMFGSRAGSMSPPTSNFAFGRVAFADGQANSDLSKVIVNGKKKGTSDPKAALAAAEKKQARLNSFDENKRADIETKDLWLNAKKKVHGERVRDDTSLLKKTLKRKEKTKAKSEKEWTERIEGVSKGQEIRQKKREGNLAKRKEDKGSKGKGKSVKKGAPKKKKRPGFEGSFSGRSK